MDINTNTSESNSKPTLPEIYTRIRGEYCIIRSYGAGIFFGVLENIEDNYTVELSKCRRIWSWAGALSISEIAQNGLSTKGSTLSITIDSHYIFQVIEIIPCTLKAAKALIHYGIEE